MRSVGANAGRLLNRGSLPQGVAQRIGGGFAQAVAPVSLLGLWGVGALAALGCGILVAQGTWDLPVGVFALIGVVGVAIRGKLTVIAILVAAVLYQAPIASIGTLPGVTLAEFSVPILLAFASAGLLRRRTKREWGLIEKAVAAYSVVLAVNLFRSRYLLTTIPNGVNRAYYDYFVALGTFAVARELVLERRIEMAHLIRTLYRFATLGTLVGIVAVAAHLPLQLGNLRYSVYDYSTGAVRAGFLEVFGAIGLAVAITHPVRYRALSVSLFAAALIVSGGRTATVGAVVATAVYVVAVMRKSPRVIALVSLVICAIGVSAVWAWPLLRGEPQIQRIASINSKTFGAAGRQLIYERSLAEFEQHPLVGTGLGVRSNVVAPDAQVSSDPAVSAFYQAQLEVGGHATYAALLKNFGLLGVVPFVAALAAAITKAARIRSPVGGFFFIAIGTQAVAIIAAGNGGDPLFFLLLGACAAWIAMKREPLAAAESRACDGSSPIATDA